MTREPYVFYCEGGCKQYVLVNINTSLDGEHVMVCPSCKHHHYRKIKNGVITDFRHSSGDSADTIEPMPSAVFKTREEALEAMGIGKQTRDPFIQELWRRKAQDEGWMQ
jgi:hypothetical protein